MTHADHICGEREKCRALVEALQELGVDDARALLWHAAELMGWKPEELLGIDVDEMTG